MVTFTFVLLVTPRVIYTVLGGSIHASGFSYEKDPWIDLILYCMYWGHYAINFFIYVVRIQTYRSAYYFFLKEVTLSSNYALANYTFQKYKCIPKYLYLNFEFQMKNQLTSICWPNIAMDKY